MDQHSKWFKRWVAYRRVLRDSDIVIYILDARDPEGTFDKKMSRYKSKIILVVNKCDLVPPKSVAHLRDYFRGYRLVFTSCANNSGIKELLSAIHAFSSDSNERPKVGVVGYPNVGKSSLLNRLSKRHAAVVSPTPGETKGAQWISTDDFFLVDTPGVIPEEDRSGGKQLVIRGAITPDKAADPEPIAEEVLSKFISQSPTSIFKTYKVQVLKNEDPASLMERIAIKRGRLLKEGEPDIYEISKIIIRDYQHGKLHLDFDTKEQKKKDSPKTAKPKEKN